MSDWKRNRLHVLRAERRWTQQDLAERVDRHPSTVSLWESGETEPRPKMKARIATAFGVDVSALVASEAQAHTA